MDGRNGVAQMITRQRQQQELIQYQLIKLYERYHDLEELEREYKRKQEEFEQMVQARRKKVK